MVEHAILQPPCGAIMTDRKLTEQKLKALADKHCLGAEWGWIYLLALLRDVEATVREDAERKGREGVVNGALMAMKAACKGAADRARKDERERAASRAELKLAMLWPGQFTTEPGHCDKGVCPLCAMRDAILRDEK